MNRNKHQERLSKHQIATEDEKELMEKIWEYEDIYFDDMRFEPDSITSNFFAVEFQDDSGEKIKTYESTPFPIPFLSDIVHN